MKIIIRTVVILLALSAAVMAQNYKIKKDDFNKTLKQINDSLPVSWLAKTDTSYPDEIIIQSSVIDLEPDITSNDPPQLKGQCEIFIRIEPRISPDTIDIIRKRNKELKEKLPPQISKDNLGNWYTQNNKTLKILDAEPTHYDNNYSYRIKCRRLPKNENDMIKYHQIMALLNRFFKNYHD